MEIRFDDVVAALKALGVLAHVEQTGGGVATIYVGAADADGRYKVCVGPGYFAGPGWTDGRGDTVELAIGPDDDGETRPTFAESDWTVARVVGACLGWYVKS